MPASDSTCSVFANWYLPDDWDTTVTVVIRYAISVATTYSVLWQFTGLVLGSGTLASRGNIFNNNNANDFVAATSNTVYEKTIALNNANIVGGGILGVDLGSDASNSGALRIYGMWLTKT